MPSVIRNRTLQLRRGASRAATYLPTLTSAPYTAFGARRIVSGYNGALFRLRRASDNATLDVGAASTSDPNPDLAAIDTWAGGARVYVAGVYEQAASGANAQGTFLAQTTAAKQPEFDTTQTINGVGAFIWEGLSTQSKLLSIPCAHNANNLTVMDVFDPVTSFNQNSFWASNIGTASWLGPFLDGSGTAGTTGLQVLGTTTLAPGAGAIPRAQPSVTGVTSNATNLILYTRETSFSGAPDTASGVADNFALGEFIGSAAYNSKCRRWGWVAYPALSNADAISLRNALNTMFAIRTSFDRRIVFDGDSIFDRGQSTQLREMLYYTAPLITGSPEIFNMAVAGQSMNGGPYPNRVARFAGLYTSAYGAGRCLFLEEGGINDLGGGSTGANLYTTYSSPVATYLKGLGYKVGVQRLLPVTTTAYGTAIATVQAEKANYNALLPGTWDFLDDPTVNAAFDTNSDADNTTYFADKLHPTSAGFAILGPIHAATINAAWG